VRYLLDTQAFIWLDNNQEKLTTTVTEICRDADNQLNLSIASVWEMQIKIKPGKLSLPALKSVVMSLAQMVTEQQKANNIQLLAVELRHVLALDSLLRHRLSI
jgi:PIN domain nuclease of toxin-antitoxin system